MSLSKERFTCRQTINADDLTNRILAQPAAFISCRGVDQRYEDGEPGDGSNGTGGGGGGGAGAGEEEEDTYEEFATNILHKNVLVPKTKRHGKYASYSYIIVYYILTK